MIYPYFSDLHTFSANFITEHKQEKSGSVGSTHSSSLVSAKLFRCIYIYQSLIILYEQCGTVLCCKCTMYCQKMYNKCVQVLNIQPTLGHNWAQYAYTHRLDMEEGDLIKEEVDRHKSEEGIHTNLIKGGQQNQIVECSKENLKHNIKLLRKNCTVER